MFGVACDIGEVAAIIKLYDDMSKITGPARIASAASDAVNGVLNVASRSGSLWQSIANFFSRFSSSVRATARGYRRIPTRVANPLDGLIAL